MHNPCFGEVIAEQEVVGREEQPSVFKKFESSSFLQFLCEEKSQ